MHFISRVANLVTGAQFFAHLRIAGNAKNGWQHVVVSDDFIRHLARLDPARPTQYRRHSVSAFPIRILLAAERCHPRIRPGVHVRTVVGRVHDKSVVRDAKVIERLQHRADILVVIDHGVVVRALPAASLTDALRLRMGAQVHVGEVYPNEERPVRSRLSLDEIGGSVRNVVVNGFHPLLG